MNNIKESMGNDIVPLMTVSSERLEFYGDSVIKTIVAKYLYLRYYLS